jgi:hypothetical protein
MTRTLTSWSASNDLEKHFHPSETRASAARRVSEGGPVTSIDSINPRADNS